MEIKNKKGMSKLVWIIIAVAIILIVGIVAWMFLSGNGSSIIPGLGGSPIPQPPALPD
jgi:flagellar basal body-associated protein FliL